MKLPDFKSFEPFNQLRKQMGANDLGDFSLVISFESITSEEVSQLETKGVEIESLDSIYELEDGTLAYKDTRVLLYIRDINISSGRYSKKKEFPKFHVSWCTTLQNMKDNKRFDRYVLSTRTDGVFEIRKTNKYLSDTKIANERLNVCKNCLDKLHYSGFRYGRPKSQNDNAFNAFDISDFFNKYPKSPLNSKPKPKYTSTTAPTDAYPDNFNEISRNYREKCGWICEKCRVNLSAKTLRKYLHTHHINGRKDENDDANLIALCVHCHANEPDHAMMKLTPDYIKFKLIMSRN